MTQVIVIGKALILLVIANSIPVVLNNIFGSRFAHAIDCGYRFVDGRPLFGHSKTLRGLAGSLLATALCAPLLGIPWSVGALFALSAMAGDLFSSFLKRRFGKAPSSRAIGLDQIPEALLPLLVCRAWLDLSWVGITVCVIIFMVLELSFAPLFYLLRLKNRPY